MSTSVEPSPWRPTARMAISLVKGPFVATYAGGILSGSNFYDRQSTLTTPFDLEGAKKDLLQPV